MSFSKSESKMRKYSKIAKSTHSSSSIHSKKKRPASILIEDQQLESSTREKICSHCGSKVSMKASEKKDQDSEDLSDYFEEAKDFQDRFESPLP